MWRGKKGIASKIVYEAVEAFIKKAGGNVAQGYAQFEKAVLSVKPVLEVRPRRVGGGIYQVPTEVRPSRSLALALRWIIEAAKKRSDKTMGKRLANELLDAVEGRGGAVKKKAESKLSDIGRKIGHLRAMEKTLLNLLRACRARLKTDDCPILKSLESPERK